MYSSVISVLRKKSDNAIQAFFSASVRILAVFAGSDSVCGIGIARGIGSVHGIVLT